MAVDIIDRSKLSGLIPEPVTREIIQGAVTESAVLRMARRLPNMTSKTQTLNVLDALPTAYFVNGEPTTGASDSKASLKKTTNMAWDKKKFTLRKSRLSSPFQKRCWMIAITISGARFGLDSRRHSERSSTPLFCTARTSRLLGVMALSLLPLPQALL